MGIFPRRMRSGNLRGETVAVLRSGVNEVKRAENYRAEKILRVVSGRFPQALKRGSCKRCCRG